jgi:hypothetical protein
MNSFIIGLVVTLLTSNIALAQANKIIDFSLLHEGAGASEVIVKINPKGEVFAYTKSCLGRQLTANEQKQTQVYFTEDKAAVIMEIFDNKAILAQEIRLFGGIGGMWFSISLNYMTTDLTGKPVTKTTKIMNPLVLINGQVSPVISEIDQKSQAANAAFCQSVGEG